MTQKHKLKTIGLLGGSFNPPHQGHVHISLYAKKLLLLDELWWLVSPQNPLKLNHETANYLTRVQACKSITKNWDWIHISTHEKDKALCYTFDTLTSLHDTYPKYQFIWIMGSDNMQTFHSWKHWQDIQHLVPIAIMNRTTTKESSLSLSPAFQNITPVKNPKTLLNHPIPCWCYLDIPPHPASSSSIRKK